MCRHCPPRNDAASRVGSPTPQGHPPLLDDSVQLYRDRMTTIEPVAVLSASESWDLLASVSLGRVVTSVAGQPEIFPVNFVVQRRTIFFRTAEGTKLVSAAVNNHVLFEADDHDVEQGWSVVVKGVGECCAPVRSWRRPNARSLCPGPQRRSSTMFGFSRCRLPADVSGSALNRIATRPLHEAHTAQGGKEFSAQRSQVLALTEPGRNSPNPTACRRIRRVRGCRR